MSSRYKAEAEVTGWVGWIFFAGCIMILSGIFQAIAGLVAMFKDSIFVVNQSHLVVLDYRQWGIVQLVLGIIVLLSAFSLMAGQMWGRIVAILLASLSAVANFAFLDAYPLWSLTVIVLDVLVIYSIARHGSELQGLREE